MKISIVTPSFDRADYLDDTIESVLTQAGDFDLEYVIQNAGEFGGGPRDPGPLGEQGCLRRLPAALPGAAISGRA